MIAIFRTVEPTQTRRTSGEKNNNKQSSNRAPSTLVSAQTTPPLGEESHTTRSNEGGARYADVVPLDRLTD